MSALLQFVQANLTALQAIFGWLTTCVGGAYVLYKLWLDRRGRREQEGHSDPADQQEAQRARNQPGNRPSWPIQKLVRSRLTASVIGVALIVGGLAIAVPVTYDSMTTVTVEYNVCEGEYEACGFPHVDRIYCQLPGLATIDDWARKRCLRWTAVNVGSHGGNKCGYTNWAVSCTKRRP